MHYALQVVSQANGQTVDSILVTTNRNNIVEKASISSEYIQMDRYDLEVIDISKPNVVLATNEDILEPNW